MFTSVHFLGTLMYSKDCLLLFTRLTLIFLQIFNNYFNKSLQLIMSFHQWLQTLIRRINPLLDRIISIQKALNDG